MRGPGGRLVVLKSLIRAFGLVGGLLYGLHAGVEIAVPERITADAMLAALSEVPVPTTVFGVPFHFELLTASRTPVDLPHLICAVTGGELIRPEIPLAFAAPFGLPLAASDAYVVPDEGTPAAEIEDRLAVLIAPFKRPQSLHRLVALPRTATGKRVRDLGALRAAAAVPLVPDR